MPHHGINREYSVGSGVSKVVRNYANPSIYEESSVEVVENKESREPGTRAPEWIRDPSVHVVIIPGRRIVCDDWRTFIIVVVIDHFRL
jgi:hypothetical protein